MTEITWFHCVSVWHDFNVLISIVTHLLSFTSPRTLSKMLSLRISRWIRCNRWIRVMARKISRATRAMIGSDRMVPSFPSCSIRMAMISASDTSIHSVTTYLKLWAKKRAFSLWFSFSPSTYPYIIACFVASKVFHNIGMSAHFHDCQLVSDLVELLFCCLWYFLDGNLFPYMV